MSNQLTAPVTLPPLPQPRARRTPCFIIAAIGAVVAIVLAVLTDGLERDRQRAYFESEATRLTRGIENQLDDSIRPLTALAVFLESQPIPSPDRFDALARKIGSLGVPIGRLAWEPRVAGQDRDAFEQEARASGLPNYRIVTITHDGRFEPAAPADEYFPIRLETVLGNFPSALGFDITSDPNRREVIELARDLGAPVALIPTLRQLALRRQTAYLIYWPLFDTEAIPDTIAERRRHLTAYITTAVPLEHMLRRALQDLPLKEMTILFSVANPRSIDPPVPIARLNEQNGLAVASLDVELPPSSDWVYRHNFTMFGQNWSITATMPAETIGQGPYALTWFVGGFTALGTAVLVFILSHIMRQAERDRFQRERVETLMAELEQANHALAEANVHLRDRERASTALAQARTHFLAAASHDLRQPLHALALFASALLRRVTGGVARELVENIRDLTASMQGMFNSLLDLSRLDAGAVRPQLAPSDPAPLVHQLHTEFTPQASAKNLSLRLAGHFPSVDTDPHLLESILRNLIDNAIKFTAHGGVLIAGRRRGQHLVIEVWDTGAGIPSDRISSVFEEFERLEQTARIPGFGLGLPIVRQLCRLIGAQLTVCSRPGHGSRFAVSLRLATGAVVRPDEDSDPMPVPACRILLVDDEENVLRALSLELRDLGHTVTVASSDADPLALIEGETPFDLAILDLRLGGCHDGWDMAATWGARRPGVPVILMTGSTDPETLRRARDAGLPTLFKPVLPAQLRRAIAAAIAAPGPASAPS